MKNKVATIFFIIGILVIFIGIIGSFMLGGLFPNTNYLNDYKVNVEEESYNIKIALIGSSISLITGVGFIGVGEIINLLQQNLTATIAISKAINNYVIKTSSIEQNKSSPKNIDLEKIKSLLS